MEYHVFKSQLAESVARKLGESCRIMIREIPKNNGIRKESMTVLREEGQAVPAICLEPYFKAYQMGVSISELAERFLAEFRAGQITPCQDMEFFLHYEKVAPGICYKLINYEKNKELLQNQPHRRILDLALVYYYHMDKFGDHSASIMICNDHMERWGIGEAQLYEAARNSTCRLLPPKLSGILQIIEELSEELDWPDMKIEVPEDEMMYVLTNQDRYFGAVCFLYPEVAQDIAEIFSSNFYILPSSIHECIIVPDSGHVFPNELKELVEDVNYRCVDAEEILSDHVYYYDRFKQTFSFVHYGKWMAS